METNLRREIRAFMRYWLAREAYLDAWAINQNRAEAARQLPGPLTDGDRAGLDATAMDARIAKAAYDDARGALERLLEDPGE